MSFAVLFDEHDNPPLRQTLGRLLATARTADLAINHIRLAVLDLTENEAGGLEHCRVMLGHLDPSVLDPAAGGPANIGVLRAFAQSGRLEIRTAPHHLWNPDFSVFHGLPDGESAVLLGAHYFGRPYPLFGLAFTCFMTQPSAVRSAVRRFEGLWNAGYDVLPVVIETLAAL